MVKAVLEELHARVNMLLEFCTLNDVAFAKILKKFVKMSPSPQDAESVREEFTAVLEREAFNDAEVTNQLLAQVMKQYSQSITNGNRQHAAKLLLNSWTNGDVSHLPWKLSLSPTSISDCSLPVLAQLTTEQTSGASRAQRASHCVTRWHSSSTWMV